jgi:hypothetical protein
VIETPVEEKPNAVESRSHIRRRRKGLPRWLLEAVLVALSVALGFAVAQFGEYRADRELAARVLAGFEAEIKQNLAALEPFVPVHRQWLDALRNVDMSSQPSRSAFDTFFALRPTLPTGAQSSFAVLRRSAWDTAVAGGALRLIDYDTVAALSETYRIQEIVTSNIDRRLAEGVLSSTATYDPASRAASLALLRFTLTDLVYAEQLLVGRYREELVRIAAPANRSR